jgi:ribose transport system permease protein
MTPRQPASIRQEGKVFPIAFAKGFITIVAATLILVVLCLVFAPSSVSSGALAGSLPFASVLAIVGLGQMLVVQQGGFDLSVAGGVSLSVVLVTHYPAGDDAQLLPAILIALGCALLIGVCNVRRQIKWVFRTV